MIKLRLLTALLLIPLVCLGIALLPFSAFLLACFMVFSLGLWEWARLGGLERGWQRVGYWIAFTAACGGLFFLKTSWVLGSGAGLTVLVTVWICCYPLGQSFLRSTWFRLAFGILYLALAWYAILVLRESPGGKLWLLSLLLIVWATDTFAYLVGRSFGRTPLAPAISPQKTQAGVVGGIGGALITGAIIYGVVRYLEIPFLNSILWFGLVLGTALLAVIGDLFESVMKRLAHQKDSGHWLPGHGGILDRVDSLLTAAPFFTLCVGWWEIL